MALTRQQKLNIAWADWIAGAASSSTGLLSFGIAGAASWLYYQDHYANPRASINPNPDPDPENEGEQIGFWHNQLCRSFAEGVYGNVTYSDMVSVASNLRPDLESEIHSISEIDFRTVVELVLEHEFVNSHQWQESIVREKFGLSGSDITSFNEIIDDINADPGDDNFYTKYEELLAQIASYSIPEAKKTYFLNSLGILKYSFYLWIAD